MGVDYSLFWSMTPIKLMPFVRAYEEKKRVEIEGANFITWIAGIYMSYSIAAVLGENNKYPEKPIQIYETENDEAEREAEEANLFGAYAAMFNKEFKERSEG